MTRLIDTIFVHCSYTKPSMDIDAATIRNWHVNDNGWRDIGYHYVIKRDGTVEPGRDEQVKGAHARGHNDTSIGICLVGGMAGDGEADFNFTFAQMQSLHALWMNIQRRHGKGMRVLGHREVDDTKACPCFDVQAFFDGEKVGV